MPLPDYTVHAEFAVTLNASAVGPVRFTVANDIYVEAHDVIGFQVPSDFDEPIVCEDLSNMSSPWQYQSFGHII